MDASEKTFNFSNAHHDLMARDAEHVLGWRYEPRILFKSGKGVMITDVDGNDYFDLTSGMMSLVLGHSHPELTECIKQQAEQLVHTSSWYSNPWLVEYAELIVSTLPDGLDVVNFAVTGSEANEIAMRMALGVTGKYDIVTVIRGLHGGSLAAEALTTVGGARKASLGPLMIPAHRNAILAPFCYRCPVNLEYPGCDVACLKQSEEMMELLTSQEVAAIMAETIPVAGGQGNRRGGARQGRRTLGRHLFRRPAASGGGAEAAADRAARQSGGPCGQGRRASEIVPRSVRRQLRFRRRCTGHGSLLHVRRGRSQERQCARFRHGRADPLQRAARRLGDYRGQELHSHLSAADHHRG
jgi:hypothetical protein